MSFMPVGPLQGRNEDASVPQRKRRAVPPAYGAQAFHAPSTADLNGANGSQELPPPPPRGANLSTRPNGAVPTSPLDFGHPAPPPSTTTVTPPSIASHLPGVLNPHGGSPQDNLWSPTTAQNGFHPPSEPSGPPPPGSRRESSSTGSTRTRRLATPTASFARPPTEPTNASPTFPSVTPPPVASFTAPTTLYYTEIVEPVRPIPTIPTSTTPVASNSAFRPDSSPAPSSSPSMFSPVGRGANLFESSPSGESIGSRLSAVPSTTADFFGDSDGDLPLFGSEPTPLSIVHDDSIHKTQATRVSGLFEVTPSPSPPPVESSNPASVKLHTPILSDSASSLFEDDDSAPADVFAVPKRPETESFASTTIPHSSPTVPASTTSLDLDTTTTTTTTHVTHHPAAVAMPDLFSAAEEDDLFLDAPIDISTLRASQNAPVVPQSIQERPESAYASDEPSFGLTTPAATLETTPSEITFMSAPAPVDPPSPVFLQTPPAFTPTTSTAAAPTLDFATAPETAFSTSPASVSASVAPHAPIVVPTPPSPLEDSLFGEADDGELDFGSFTTPSFVSPPVVNTALLTANIPAPVQQEATLTNYGPVVVPTTVPESSTESLFPTEPVAESEPVSLPTVDFKNAVVDIKSSAAVEKETTLEHNADLHLDLTPTASHIDENGFVAPPPTSFGGVVPNARAPKASGPKRPRHFQYTAGQPIPVPSQSASLTGLDASAPPPTSRHPPLPGVAAAAAPPMTSTAPSFFVPVTAPLPGSAPPVVAPVPETTSDYNSHHDSTHSTSFAGAEQDQSAPPKKSLLESFGEKGISWLRSKVGGAGSPTNSDTSAHQEPTHHHHHHHHNEHELYHTSEPAPFNALPPSATAPVTGMPAITLVGTPAKKQPKKTAKPVPAFKSNFTPITAPVPLSDPVTTTATIATGISNPEPTAVPPPAVTFAEISSGSVFEDHPFHATSGLVSIDYSMPSPLVVGDAGPLKPNTSNADPFGSDEHVTATDLFHRLRDAIMPSTSSTPSSPSLSSSVDINGSSSSLVKADLTHIAPNAPSSQLNQTLSSSLDAPVDGLLNGGPMSPLNTSTMTIPLDSPTQHRSARQAITNSTELITAQNQVQSLQHKIKELTEELTTVTQERDRASVQASTLYATERDLRAQLAQLSKSADSVSLGSAAALQQQQQEIQRLRAEFQAQTSALNARVTQAESRAMEAEKANVMMQANAAASARKIADLEAEKLGTSSAAQSELEARIHELEKSLQDARRSVSSAQSLADSNESEATTWKSKFESELALSRKKAQEHDAVVSKMEEDYRAKVEEHARAMKVQESLLAEAHSLKVSKSISAEWEQKQAEETARALQENERYIAVMQQQAASQTSVIDRLILQNADLVKAVEFARRVLQEAKNPDSLSGAMADNDRLRDELESAERELASLRQRNSDLTVKANHFESECEELSRKFNSIDYRLLMQSGGPGSSPAPIPTTSLSSSTASSSSSMASPTLAPLRSNSPISAPSGPIATPVEAKLETPASTGISPSSIAVPSTPGDWQPKSPLWSPTIDSPVQSPSRLTAPAAPAPSTSTPISASPTFIVTAPIETHIPTASGLQHGHMSPQIDLDELDGTVSTDLGDLAAPTLAPSSAPPTPSSTPGRALRVAPQRGLFGRIWQAVTLQ